MKDKKMSLLDRLKSLLSGSPSGSNGEGATSLEMISCEDALNLVHDFLDGELPDVPEAQVRKHFEVCQGCYPHLQLETVFRDALRRAASGQTAPDELRDRITTLIADARAEGG